MQLVTLLGPTCSGKSQMAVDLFNYYSQKGQKAVIVNCDSRQIYQDLNLGTAKVPGQWLIAKNFQREVKFFGQNRDFQQSFVKVESDLSTSGTSGNHRSFLNSALSTGQVFTWQEAPHFLIDFVPVWADYNLVNFVQDWASLVDFLKMNLIEIVILTGGTGLWAKAIVDQYQLGIIKSQYQNSWQSLKNQLEVTSLANLQKKYLENVNKATSESRSLGYRQQNLSSIPVGLKFSAQKLSNPESMPLNPTENQFNLLNQSDFYNPMRLINWLLRFNSQNLGWTQPLAYPQFTNQQTFAIKTEPLNLKAKITLGIKHRIKMGLEKEVAQLLNKFGRSKLWQLGLEYRQTVLFLEGQLDKYTWQESLIQQNWQYARRQKTWLVKQDVVWISNLHELTSQLSL